MADLELTALGAISGEPLCGPLRFAAAAPLGELRRGVAQHAGHAGVKLFLDGQPLAGKTLAEAGLRDGDEIQVVFSKSQQILAGAMDGSFSLWDLEGPTKVQELQHGSELHCAAVSGDGQLVATAGSNAQVVLWRRDPLDVEFNLQGHAGQVYSISFCPVSSSLFSASGDATARLWDLETGLELLCLRGHRRDVNACDVSPCGQLLATGSDDYCFATWDRRSGQQTMHWDGRRGDGHSGRVYAVAFAPGGHYLATGAVDKKAKLWDLRKGGCLTAFTKHTDLVNSVAFSKDGALLASASDDAFVHVWTLEGVVVACHEHPEAVLSANFSDTGLLATGCGDGILRIFKDEEEPLELCSVPPSGLKSVGFLP